MMRLPAIDMEVAENTTTKTITRRTIGTVFLLRALRERAVTGTRARCIQNDATNVITKHTKKSVAAKMMLLITKGGHTRTNYMALNSGTQMAVLRKRVESP